MVLEKFPGVNLIGQLIRQITQPLSRVIVKHVRKRPFLRKYVLIQLGRFYYWCENKVKLRTVPSVKIRRKPADEVGAQLLLELLIFGVLGNVIIYETHRTAKRARVAEQTRIQQLKDLEAEKNRLMQRVEHQVILTKQLKEVIVEYARQVGCTLPSDPSGNREG
ncbi:hypothetical protein DMN91_004891 [Ooceraea biroi]|uniref:Putative OPA3-like protein n=1 Tax=Ooceraea biroi TaxID=2015173 RepID=A0A026VT90_OOCBI|nr:Putative OPA3-like protein [Ooceraea biroi]RLU22613.1 hypothetical protein DMN91_004891 [Ooceraea biroi]